MKALLLVLLAPVAAQAQLALYAVNGTTEAAVGSTYQFGAVPLNTTLSVQFQVYNNGPDPVTVNAPTLSGAGFTFEYPPAPSYVIPPKSTEAQAENIWISFTPTSALSCSVDCNASLQVGSLSVFLLGSGIAAPALTAVAGCSGSGSFNFGNLPTGSSATCSFVLKNSNPQAVVVSSIVVSGLGFSGPSGVTAPLTLEPGQSASFSISFAPAQAMSYSGTLAVASQSFPLSGTGQSAQTTTSSLFPTPSLVFDSASYTSGQQGVLKMTLPTPAPVAATGYVNLTFTPSTPVVKDDTEIVFLEGSVRSLPFSVNAGATTVLLNGQSSATFQTGTTEGTITFTVTSAAISGSPPTTNIPIPGAPVIVDSATASEEVLGSLVITITGADNTYSTGMMTFSFFDTSGNPIGNAVSADFSSMFKSYYATVNASGSAFMAQVTFPVVGSVANIGTVTVTLTNAAGQASTGSLTFQ
jgi:hypothetical protein